MSAEKSVTPKPRVRRTNAQIAADERAKQARLDAIAAEKAAKLPTPVEKRRKVTVYFLEDGVTLMGKVWYYGEEVTVMEGTEEWDLCVDRYGNFILDKTREEQLQAYGVQRWEHGHWPGLGYDLNASFERDFVSESGNEKLVLSDAERKILEKVNKQRGLITR